MKRLAGLTAFIVAATFAHGASSQHLPQGWRMPSAEELGDPARKASAVGFAKATADFNNDAVPDEALLLKSTRFSGEALWVKLSNEGAFSWIKLDETDWGRQYPNVDFSMAIEVVPPGIHAYACFDDADDCNFGPVNERPKLRLRDPSLRYFKMESAASLFFWSKKYQRFMRVWLSD